MKKKVNLTQFKNLVKRIIKEEKNNLEKKKSVIFTESQLRNQVRKMLKEYDNKYSNSSQSGTITIDPLPNGDVLEIKFTGGWIPGKYSPDIDWVIKEAILYTDNGEMEIDIHEPKYVKLLKIADDAISDYLDSHGIRY